MGARRGLTGATGRFVLFSLALGVTALAVAGLLGGDWALVCDHSHATGLMDCGAQPDAAWRSSHVPGWISLDVLIAGAAIGVLGMCGAVLVELAVRRRSS